jgi:beta-glucosidase
MKKPLNRKVFRRLSVGLGALLVIACGGLDIATANASAVNHALNIQTFKIVDSGEPSGDTEYFKTEHSDQESLKKYCEDTAVKAEEEGLVLLKNENAALPLAKNSRISLFGTASAKINYSVSGSSSTAGVSYPNIDDVFNANGLAVNPTLMDFYRTGAGSKYGRSSYMLVGQVKECPWSAYDETTLASVSDYGDAAIVILARDSGEGSDIGVTGSDGEDGSYLSISKEEEDLLKQLTVLKEKGTIKKLVVLLNTAVPIETDFLFRSGIAVDSCLWIGNVGAYGLTGVAHVLNGSAVPSGHLNDTFLRDNLSSPAMASWILNPQMKFSQKYANWKDKNLNPTQYCYAAYVEGVYVGYRYYETRYEDTVMKTSGTGSFTYADQVSFPFGYGLSYTDFSYSDFAVAEEEKSYKASVTVTNTGKTYSGKEAVQIYLQKPYTDYDKANGIEKPAAELVGFAKTSSLAPGASEKVTVEVSKEELKSYDANGAKTYVLDSGKYYLTAGKNAHDAVNNILAAKGFTKSDGMDSDGNSALVKDVLNQKDLDATTYSVSAETGKKVTNQLDFMDVNRYEGSGENKVTYVSRGNWEGTWPSAAVSLSVATDEMATDLQSDKPMPDEGTTMPNYGVDSGLQLISLRSTEKTEIAYDNPMWDTLLDEMTYGEQAQLLTSAGFSTVAVPSIGKPTTADNDGPTAIVGTKTGSVFPSKSIIAATFNKDLIEEIGKALAEDTRFAGFQSIYAPGINLHRTPFGGRLNEYYSEDAYLTGKSCVLEITGMQSKGVIPTVKHFAFNNEETNRNGIGIWMNEQEARELMLKPFEMAMRPSIGHAHAIMTSFNRAGCIWTSASPELMISINRDEFGFDGYSLTDMAASNAGAYMLYNDGIFNGTDLYLGTGGTDKLDAYKDNAKFCQRMRDACHHVLYSIANYSAAMNGISSTTKVVLITPWWKTLLVTLIIVSAIGVAASLTFVILSYVQKPKEEKKA